MRNIIVKLRAALAPYVDELKKLRCHVVVVEAVRAYGSLPFRTHKSSAKESATRDPRSPETTLTPPQTQNGARQGKENPLDMGKLQSCANPCND
jgi:hypothetical protein